MLTNGAGETVTSLNGGVNPSQVGQQGMRRDAASILTSRDLELLEVQQRVQLFDYIQRAQHYQRLHAALVPTTGRLLPSTSSHHTAPASLGCGGFLSFICSKLHDGTSQISPSQQHLRFLHAAAAAAAAAATTPATQHDEPKPSQSYIGLIAMAILSSKERKLVLSDIYQWILDHYAYFRYRGPGWRNSIRHNLSLNDCFVKAGRSANGKGHYWAIHPANIDDFERGDFRRRRAQRKVRRAMGLSVPDDEDSPGPSPSGSSVVGPSYCSWTPSRPSPFFFAQQSQSVPDNWNRVTAAAASEDRSIALDPQQSGTLYGRDQAATRHHHSRVRRRLFDMDSLLAPDDDDDQRTQLDVTGTDTDYCSDISRHQNDDEHVPYLLTDGNADSQCKVTSDTMIV